MSRKVHVLRSLVEQRLTLAAEEIFGLFERTIAEYEEELCRTKEENNRQRQILDTVLLHTTVGSTVKEVPPEQKDWTPILDLNQEDPEAQHIKHEQEELWTNQEVDIITFPPTCAPLKSENEDEVQSFQLHQKQNEKKREEASGSIYPNTHFYVEDQTEDSEDTEDTDEDWTPSRRPHTQVSSRRPQTQVSSKRPQTQLSLGSSSRQKFNTSDCSLNLAQVPDTLSRNILKQNFIVMDMGSKTKRYQCSVCNKLFERMPYLQIHMRVHTGEKPFSCSVCGKRFAVKSNLIPHMKIHTGEKPFGCTVCGNKFTQKSHLADHMKRHTGEKPFSCSICHKRFRQKSHVRRHMAAHTGDQRLVQYMVPDLIMSQTYVSHDGPFFMPYGGHASSTV